MHICLVYDLLFPYTIGGAERWYRSLAERLAAEGHRVTYLTLRHWPEGEVVEVPGVEVVPVGPRLELLHRKRTEADLAGTSLRLRRTPPSRPRRRLAMTSSTLPRSPTSRCSRPRWPGDDILSGSSSIGSRSGRASTGANTWDRSEGASDSRCNAAASAYGTTLSASRGCSHDGFGSRACAAM